MMRRALVPPALLRKKVPDTAEGSVAYAIALMIFERQRALGITAKELADRAGMRASNISRICSGHTTPSPVVLDRLARAMDARFVMQMIPITEEEDPS